MKELMGLVYFVQWSLPNHEHVSWTGYERFDLNAKLSHQNRMKTNNLSSDQRKFSSLVKDVFFGKDSASE